MPETGANGAAELFDRQVPRSALWWTPAKQHPDHAEIADRVDPTRHGKAELRKNGTAQCRTDRTADIDADAVRSYRTLQALRRNELRHDGLPGGRLKCAEYCA